MGNMTLSKLQKKQYQEIVNTFGTKNFANFSRKDYIRLKETLGILQVLGYIESSDIDNTYAFEKIGEFSDFDKWHKDKLREERKMSIREWKIAIISALIGLIPFIITTVIPWVISLVK